MQQRPAVDAHAPYGREKIVSGRSLSHCETELEVPVLCDLQNLSPNDMTAIVAMICLKWHG